MGFLGAALIFLAQFWDGSLLNQGVSGLFFALLVTGVVAVAAFALGAWVWARCCRRHREAGNPLYSNVLYKPRRAPRKSEAWPVEGKVLDIPREDQNGQSFYSISLPQHPTAKQHLAPKSCPRPSPPISVFRVSPASGASGSQESSLKREKESEPPETREDPPSGYVKMQLIPAGQGVQPETLCSLPLPYPQNTK
uniref:Uncharacterized protein n=1 Tax=Sus scrofa TaxID=9823 RepID=A0A4X1VM66_PIG